MNSIVLWVGGLAATAIGVVFWDRVWSPPYMAAAFVLLVLATSMSLGGHNDE